MGFRGCSCKMRYSENSRSRKNDSSSWALVVGKTMNNRKMREQSSSGWKGNGLVETQTLLLVVRLAT